MDIIKTNEEVANEQELESLASQFMGPASKHSYARFLRRAHRHWTHKAWTRKRARRAEVKKSRRLNRKNDKKKRK